MESNLPQQNISIEQLPTIIGNTFKHISEVDRKVARKLKINLTCEPKYQSQKLYRNN